MQFEYDNMEGWYAVTQDHIIQHGGGGLLAMFDDDLVKVRISST